MPPGDLIVRDLQYQLGSVLMGLNTPYIISNVNGLDVESVRTSDIANDAEGGDIPGLDLPEHRLIDFDLAIDDELSADNLSSLIDDLATYFNPSIPGVENYISHDFAFQFRNRPKMYIPVRGRRITGVKDSLYHRGAGRFALQLYSPNKDVFEVEEQLEDLSLADSVHSTSKMFGVGGTYYARPVLEIEGPCRNPRITHTETDRAIRIDIDIASSETLVIDVRDKTVKLEGVNVYSNVRSDNEWWVLLPDQNNQLTFSRSTTGLDGATSTLSVKWHNTRQIL